MTKLLAALALVISFNVHAAEVLRWAADIESGAPYSYKDPTDPSKMIGYEVEIIEAVARELGMEAKFYQNNWEGLVEGLKRNDYDVVINGLEITPDRAQVIQFSQPYYVTSEVITVRKEENKINSLEDTRDRKIGTLAASLAQRILSQQTFPMQMITYSEEVHAFNDLANGRIDAVFLDEPIAIYYGKPNKELKIVGGPVGRLEYGIATRLEDKELSGKINGALNRLIGKGEIRKILEKWGLWNTLTASQFHTDAQAKSEPVAYERYVKSINQEISWNDRLQRYINITPLLFKGAVMTLQISIISMCLAMLVGLLAALARLYGPKPISWLALAYVEMFRGTPLLIQLFLIFYGLPHVGIRLDPFVAAVLGLGLNYGACEAENYRAGILSIPKSQMDASLALGMSWGQSLRHVILPQAIRVVIPPVTNDFIALLKDSSLVSVITMVELTSTYGQLASTYFDYLGIGLLTALVYFLIGLPFVRLSRYFENSLASTAVIVDRNKKPSFVQRLTPFLFMK